MYNFQLKYDPTVMEQLAGGGRFGSTSPYGTNLTTFGAMTFCTSAANCGKGKDTFTGYTEPAAGFKTGYGFMATMAEIGGDELFHYWSSAGLPYVTINGNSVMFAQWAYAMSFGGNFGVGRMNMALTAPCATGANNCVVQDGPDCEPEMPLSLQYYRVLPTTTGSGSAIWIDMYSGFTSYVLMNTNGSATGYLAFGAGQSGTGTGTDDISHTNAWITGGVESANPNILQSGFSAPGGAGGAFQQYPALVVVQ